MLTPAVIKWKQILGFGESKTVDLGIKKSQLIIRFLER